MMGGLVSLSRWEMSERVPSLLALSRKKLGFVRDRYESFDLSSCERDGAWSTRMIGDETVGDGRESDRL